MAEIYISVGSNIDREKYIRAGIRALSERFGALTLSPVYESVAVGFEGDHFYNLVVGLQTDQDVMQVDRILSEIEDANQRDRNGPRFSSRTLDLDLLLYDDLILQRGKLVLPRPEIYHNAFVLKPLVDIAAHKIDPSSGKAFEQLWDAFDRDSQQLWEVPFQWTET